MLNVFRQKHVKMIIFWSLLILILPAFVLWGTGNLGGGKGKGPKFAGMIEGKKITFDAFSSSLTAVRAQLILNYFNQPNVLNNILNNKPFLAKLAWDRLIMTGEAKKSKIKVDDKEVIGLVRSHPIFNRGGAFDDRVYEYVLRYNFGMSARQFEELVRDSVAIQKMNEGLTKDIKPTDEDMRAAYLRDNGRYRLSYVLFNLNDKLDKVSVPEEDVKAYYEANKAQIAIKPKDPEDKSPQRLAAYDEAKGDIQNFLSENAARALALNDSAEVHKKLVEAMNSQKLSFEDAAAKLELKVDKTPFISKAENVEAFGEAPILAEVLPLIKIDEVSRPIPVQKGAIIIKLVETDKIDEEKFAKEKDNYSKIALDMKKAAYLDNWIRSLEMKTVLNIDLNDIDKYFKQ